LKDGENCIQREITKLNKKSVEKQRNEKRWTSFRRDWKIKE
jgi:hypothetical protein